MPENQLIKFLAIKQSYQLTEKARMTYHGLSSLLFWELFFLVDLQSPIRRIFFSITYLITCQIRIFKNLLESGQAHCEDSAGIGDMKTSG
jgi:hypothetical protein